MKKILLILGCLMVMLGGYAAEKSTTVVFKSSTSVDGTSLANNTAISDVIESGADFISTITDFSKASYNSTNGLKFGNSNNSGNVTFKFAEKVNMTKVVVNAAKYKNDASSIKVGNETAQTLSSTLADYTFNVTGEQESITIGTDAKRGYVKSITFYYESDQASAPNYLGFEPEYTLVLDDSKALPAITPKELEYTFTSDDESIVAIEEGMMVAKGVGEATITFTTDEVEGAFLAGEGSFKVTVTKKTPKMWFNDQVVYGKLGVGVVWDAVHIEGPEGVNSESVSVKYTSSNPEIVVVDENTGRIIRNDDAEKDENLEPGLRAAGEVTITATYEGDAEYAEHSASYKIIVIDPEATDVAPATDIFDLSEEKDGKNKYGMTFQTSSNTYEKDITEIDEDSVTITFAPYTEGKEAKYRAWNNGKELRIQTETIVTFEVPEGYKITKIGFNGSKTDGNFTPTGKSTIPSNADEDWENIVTTVTWMENTTAEDYEPTNKVVYHPSETVQLTKIFVQYELANSNLNTPSLNFDQHVYALYAGEKTEVNAVNNPESVKVIYSLQNVDKDDYSIDRTREEEGKLFITVKNPGYYTLQATSPVNDTYRDGFAILRLNVYRHLNVDVDGNELAKDEDENEIIRTAEEVTVNIENLDLVNLYYQIVKEGDEPAKPADDPEAAEDENRNPGYTMVDDDEFSGYNDETNDYYITIPKYTEGELCFYIANYGYISPVRKIKLVAPAELDVTLGFDKEAIIDAEDDITLNYNFPEGAEALPGDVIITVYDEEYNTLTENEDYTLVDDDACVMIEFSNAGVYTVNVAWSGNDEYREGETTSAAITVYAAANLGNNEKGVKFTHAESADIQFMPSNDNIPAALVFAAGSKNNSIKLDISDFDEVHYRVFEYVHNAKNVPSFFAPRKAGEEEPAEGETEATEPEFTKHDGESAIELPGEHGRIQIKTVKNGVESPVEDALYTNDASLLNDIQTGVAMIEATEGTAVYFNLNGVRVEGKELKAGVYIRVADGKAAKVMVK